jgi:DNA-binding NtrC family response regulator
MHGHSVLVVEDDESVVTSLRVALTGQPITIESAGDAPAAITLLGNNHYCGLVLDLVLEEGSGFDVLRHLERSGVKVPTVVITHRLPTYVREMLDDEYIKLVLPKPVDAKLLATIVLGLCGRSAGQ